MRKKEEEEVQEICGMKGYAFANHHGGNEQLYKYILLLQQCRMKRVWVTTTEFAQFRLSVKNTPTRTHHFVSRLISSCTYAYGIAIPFCEKPKLRDTAQGNRNYHIVGNLPPRVSDRCRQAGYASGI